MELVIYTDGSSLNNGKENCVGGWSAIFLLNGKMYIRYGHLSAQSSNNKGEIGGVLYSINMLRNKKDWKLKMVSDSQYVVKSINEWRHKWVKNDYEGIKNHEYLVPLFTLWDEHGNSSIEWTRGHVGTKFNEVADEWAGRGMRNIIMEKSDDKVDIKFISEDFLEDARRNARYYS